MATRIRLQRRGRKKRPFYHIVVADTRAPRDGRFIEKLGTYNPMTSPASIEVDIDRSLEWLQKGAQPTETARAILKFKGVLYKKHLYRGVEKGAFSKEEADRMWESFMADKNAKLQARIEATAEERRKTLAAISGEVPAVEEEIPADEPTGAEGEGDDPTAEAENAENAAEGSEEDVAADPANDAPVDEEAGSEEPEVEESKADTSAADEEQKEASEASEESEDTGKEDEADDQGSDEDAEKKE